MSGWTKGPWRFFREENGQDKANARLVAAAPELAACLQYVDSVSPAQPEDGSAPLEDEELCEIIITGKALKDIRAALLRLEKGTLNA